MTDLRNEPIQKRATNRLESLRAAGRTVYHRDGRDRLTSAAVAAEAGCSIGTFYRYFPDRVALLDDIYPNRDSGAINILLAQLPDDGGPAWQFVEIENDEGASIGVGAWGGDPRSPGYARIRITMAQIAEALDRPRETKEATAA